MSNEIELYIHIKKWTDYSAIFRFRQNFSTDDELKMNRIVIRIEFER